MEGECVGDGERGGGDDGDGGACEGEAGNGSRRGGGVTGTSCGGNVNITAGGVAVGIGGGATRGSVGITSCCSAWGSASRTITVRCSPLGTCPLAHSRVRCDFSRCRAVDRPPGSLRCSKTEPSASPMPFRASMLSTNCMPRSSPCNCVLLPCNRAVISSNRRPMSSIRRFVCSTKVCQPCGAGGSSSICLRILDTMLFGSSRPRSRTHRIFMCRHRWHDPTGFRASRSHGTFARRQRTHSGWK